jgi:hypothetical protein
VCDKIELLLQKPEIHQNANLVVDSTGVGRAVVDDMRRRRLQVIGVTITAGHQVTETVVGRDYCVPKVELVSVLQVLVQSERIRISGDLPEAETLITEMTNFKTKIGSGGDEKYGAWREGQHDDLVLSVAIAAWWALRVEPASRRDLGKDPWKEDEMANRYDPIQRP